MSQLYQNKKTNTTVQNMNGSNNNSNNNINNESSYSAQQPMHQPLVPSQLQPSSYNSNTYTTPSLNRVPTPKPGTPIPSNSNNANSGGGGNSSGMYKFPYSNSRPNSGNVRRQYYYIPLIITIYLILYMYNKFIVYTIYYYLASRIQY